VTMARTRRAFCISRSKERNSEGVGSRKSDSPLGDYLLTTKEMAFVSVAPPDGVELTTS
jgi:hypothetical protein